LSRQRAVDLYFLEHRAKLLDIAAFMDRVERSRPADDANEDYRMTALRAALDVLCDGGPDRARRVHEAFSDPTTTPLGSAAGLKGAYGAYDGPPQP
jgi:hypothetical protein